MSTLLYASVFLNLLTAIGILSQEPKVDRDLFAVICVVSAILGLANIWIETHPNIITP